MTFRVFIILLLAASFAHCQRFTEYREQLALFHESYVEAEREKALTTKEGMVRIIQLNLVSQGGGVILDDAPIGKCVSCFEHVVPKMLNLSKFNQYWTKIASDRYRWEFQLKETSMEACFQFTENHFFEVACQQEERK